MEIKVNALMIRAIDYKDNDKILTLFTADKGLITAGIKGVKRAGAKLKFAAQPFCFAEYILTQKGGRYTVINATEEENFYDLRTDINKFYAASSVIDSIPSLVVEGENAYDMFYIAVRALMDMCTGDEIVVLISYLLSALSYSGYSISLSDCAVCGSSLLDCERMRFDMHTGTFSCYDCGDGVGASGVTYNVLRYALGKSYQKNAITDEGKKRALRLLKEYLIFKTESKCAPLSELIRLL